MSVQKYGPEFEPPFRRNKRKWILFRLVSIQKRAPITVEATKLFSIRGALDGYGIMLMSVSPGDAREPAMDA
ncbi:predicted protein [Coccidioides posadasii str. Silveira]|uniref:Predicted protein n=1 Tax=Coccidioides posadasii (strain RMSCC 757 / Silveira) TaxID=443226 RepID=E9CWC8_COCPS|nr:predicted protein [Coccidioides posadasii str. Silveira]